MPEVVGGGYSEFWHCRRRYRVVKGGKASKKSTTTALNFLVRLMQNPEAKFEDVVKTAPSATTPVGANQDSPAPADSPRKFSPDDIDF